MCNARDAARRESSRLVRPRGGRFESADLFFAENPVDVQEDQQPVGELHQPGEVVLAEAAPLKTIDLHPRGLALTARLVVDLEAADQVAKPGGLGAEFFAAGGHFFAAGGGLVGAFGQLADLVGHDGESRAVLTCPGGLDGGVQGQEVRLAGDFRRRFPWRFRVRRWPPAPPRGLPSAAGRTCRIVRGIRRPYGPRRRRPGGPRRRLPSGFFQAVLLRAIGPTHISLQSSGESERRGHGGLTPVPKRVGVPGFPLMRASCRKIMDG